MTMYGSGFDGFLLGLVVIGGIIGAALMGVAFWLIPFAWGFVKPWLHAVTG